jgi:soluble lytic murein transglycosylase
MEIPRPVAGRMIYGSVVTCLVLIALGAAAALRRHHPYDRLILSEAAAHGLPPALVASVIWRESRFDPRALGPVGEIGLMQITEGSVRDWAQAHREPIPDPAVLWDPAWNLRIGTWYLARAAGHWRRAGCRDPLPMALAEYNAGRSRARAWVESGGTGTDPFLDAIDIPGTRRYVEDILKRYRGGV